MSTIKKYKLVKSNENNSIFLLNKTNLLTRGNNQPMNKDELINNIVEEVYNGTANEIPYVESNQQFTQPPQQPPQAAASVGHHREPLTTAASETARPSALPPASPQLSPPSCGGGLIGLSRSAGGCKNSRGSWESKLILP